MIQISELVLRMPGINAEEGHALANDVAKLVAAGLPADVCNHSIETLNIKMSQADLSKSNNKAANIANQIIDQVKLATLK